MKLKTKLQRKGLAIAAAVAVGLLAVDRLVLGPLLAHWRDQAERIAQLRQQVEQGADLVDREPSLRKRWASMSRGTLPTDASAAEDQVLKAAARWARESRISFTSLMPQWRNHEEGHQTLECRATAQGDLRAVTRFLYELEIDPIAVRLESFEIARRDERGRTMTLNARFSALRLPEESRKSP